MTAVVEGLKMLHFLLKRQPPPPSPIAHSLFLIQHDLSKTVLQAREVYLTVRKSMQVW